MPARTVLAAISPRLLHAEIADDLHDDDAECEACQRVHRVIAAEEACEERLRGIGGIGCDVRDMRRGAQHGDHNQNRKEQQKQRIQDLADGCEDLAGEERKIERDGEEDEREDQKIEPHIAALRQDLLQPDGKRCRRAARDGEERPDRQIEQAGEKIGIGPVDLAAEVKETGAPAEAERGDAQQRQAHAGDEKAEEGGPHLAAGLLAHADGEDEVARTEEQAEQHACHHNIFFQGQVTFHRF